jgi:hypothetical protein
LVLRILEYEFSSDFVKLKFNWGSKLKIKKTKTRFNEEQKHIHHSDFGVKNFSLIPKVSSFLLFDPYCFRN